MRKFTALSIALALGLPTLSSAHNPPGELFFAVQFPDNYKPTIDGDISEWEVIPANPYTVLNDRLYSPVADIQPVGRGEIDVSDINIRHLVGWNETDNKLYFMSEIFDNIHNNDRSEPARFNHDDAWEVEVNPDHTPTEEHNLADEPANNFSYKWAVPPVDGQYQFYRPNASLAWFVDGSEWIEMGWGFTGEQFGESTYTYELAITPIESMPRGDDVTPDQVVTFDLVENEIIHLSITVGDIDEPTEGDFVLTSYQGFWTMSPESCCTATNDWVLAEVDPALADISSAVEEISWGQIKAGYAE